MMAMDVFSRFSKLLQTITTATVEQKKNVYNGRTDHLTPLPYRISMNTLRRTPYNVSILHSFGVCLSLSLLRPTHFYLMRRLFVTAVTQFHCLQFSIKRIFPRSFRFEKPTHRRRECSHRGKIAQKIHPAVRIPVSNSAVSVVYLVD